MSTPPEGWYPDPAGGPGRRWWNGRRWTEYTDLPPGPAALDQPRYGEVPQYGQPGAGQPASPQAMYGQQTYGQPVYGAAAQTRFGVPFAGFWERVGAFIIDGLIIGIPAAFVGLALFWSDLTDFLRTVAENPDANPVPSSSLTARFFGFFIIFLIAGGAYNVLMLAARGATLGMALLRIHVVDASGQNPSISRALGRWSFTQAFSIATSFVPYLGSILGLLDPLWMLWDPEKQTLHDKVAKTWVIKRLS